MAENQRFYDVFRGYRIGRSAGNGLMYTAISWETFWELKCQYSCNLQTSSLNCKAIMRKQKEPPEVFLIFFSKFIKNTCASNFSPQLY